MKEEIGVFRARTHEVRCPACGTINRLASYDVRRIPECGQCHARLPESAAMRLGREVYLLRTALLVALPIIGVLGWLTWQHTTANAPLDCAPQPRPLQGDYAIRGPLPRWAPFRINTSAGDDYLVKLESRDGTHALTFFIHGGDPFETTVPLGVYHLKYLAGATWCGPTKLFGPNAAARKGDSALSFEFRNGSYEGKTIALYLVLHGNFRTEAIPLSAF